MKFIIDEVNFECFDWFTIEFEVLLDVGDPHELHFQWDFLDDILLFFTHFHDSHLELFVQSLREQILQLLEQFKVKSIDDYQQLLIAKSQQQHSTSAQLEFQWKGKYYVHFVKFQPYLLFVKQAQNEFLGVVPLFHSCWLH